MYFRWNVYVCPNIILLNVKSRNLIPLYTCVSQYQKTCAHERSLEGLRCIYKVCMTDPLLAKYTAAQSCKLKLYLKISFFKSKK